MNGSQLILAFAATMLLLLAALIVPEGIFSGSSSGGARLQPGPPARVDSELREHRLFNRAYAAKLLDPGYQQFKSASGLPKQYQAFAQEAEIKRLRSRIAGGLQAPTGVSPTPIPMLHGAPPAIDGMFSPDEWQEALSVAIGINGADTTLLLAADREHLYLACDAVNETTDTGYDQFRFYLHLDITPNLVNERIHVGRRAGKLGGIRQTRVRWQGNAPADGAERWKTYDISDWQIYQHARGASAIDGHRRYEAVLQLEEVGLHRGIPFPTWSDVETDPSNEGASRGRRYLGQLGSQSAPVWFVIK